MKYENTRVVVFKEDYHVKAKGVDEKGNPNKKLLHPKGSRHAMHKGIVDILQKQNAKIEVSTLDYKKLEEKAKKKFNDARKKSFEVSA